MGSKQGFNSWFGIDIEAGWCSGANLASLDGCHIVRTWDVKIPAQKREVIWAQDRDAPATTVIKPKDPSEIPIKTENVWSLRPLYLLLGGGSYTAVGSTGYISQDSGTVQSFAFHQNRNGNHKTVSGCVMEEVSLIIPMDGGNLQFEWNAIGADYGGGSAIGTKPTIISDSLRADMGTYEFTSGGVEIPDYFKGGRLTFRNNLIGKTYEESPDVENGRILKPAYGNLEVEFEGDFRIDTTNTFSIAHEKALTGIFNTNFTVKNSDSTGFIIVLTGLQLDPDGYSEPVPTAQDGIVDMSIRLVQSEDFVLKNIQVTGVDPT